MKLRQGTYRGNRTYQEVGLREYEVFLEGMSKRCEEAMADAETELAADHIEEVLDFVRQECGAIKATIDALH